MNGDVTSYNYCPIPPNYCLKSYCATSGILEKVFILMKNNFEGHQFSFSIPEVSKFIKVLS